MKRDDVMKTIQGAEVCPGNAGVIKVPLSDFRHVAEGLRNDPQSPMDFLRDIVGMDWGEEGLGAIYFMESTVTGDTIAIRTATTDRQQPLLPTVSDLWKTALIKEREVYDFFGILFTGHPDMRRLFLREDWIGWPLRKDYDMKSNPLRLDNEINADITKEYRLQRDGTLQGIDHRVFGEDDFVVSMGPQHPSTHGALRMRIALDGEVVKKVDPVLGYIHRGIEKMNESLTYPQTLGMTDRLDYLSAHQAATHCVHVSNKLPASKSRNVHNTSAPSWTSFNVSILTCCSILVWYWIWVP